MLKLSSETLFIHPLPTHLAKRAVSGEKKATPHLIYKKPLHIQVDAQRTKRGMSEFDAFVAEGGKTLIVVR